MMLDIVLSMAVQFENSGDTRCYEVTLVSKHLNMKFSRRCVDKASHINPGAR
jgi:hypothetical protein